MAGTGQSLSSMHNVVKGPLMSKCQASFDMWPNVCDHMLSTLRRVVPERGLSLVTTWVSAPHVRDETQTLDVRMCK